MGLIPTFSLHEINFSTMKKWIKISAVVIVLGIIGAILGYKFIYNKPHRDYEKAKPDYVLSAEEVFRFYKDSREEATAKFTGKVLQINGMLNKVEQPDSLTIAVFAIEQGMFGDEGIRCTMLENHAKTVLAYTGKEVTIKGYCTGYNDTDVIMENCSVIND
jgi:hypothetical protein